MPRAVNGTYTLPAGNPVVTLTTISSVWGNTTMSDIATALSDSLSRSGLGPMTAGLQLASGLVGAPGLTWSAETTSGLYRSAAGDFRYSISAVDKVQITTNGIRVADGVIGTPGFSFISDTDTGFYHIGANRFAAAVGGVKLQDWGASATNPNVIYGGSSSANNAFTVNNAADSLNFFIIRGDGQAEFIDGTNAIPALSFLADTDTGIYRDAANQLSFTAGGVRVFTILTTNLQADLPIRGADGNVGTPEFSFSGDADTGIYRVGANDLGITIGGTRYMALNASVGVSSLQIFGIPDGAVGNPSLYFNSDGDTGIYRSGTNTFVLVGGGVALATFDYSNASNSVITLGSPAAGGVLALNLVTAGSATAGAATLPANPTSFLVVTINGTSRKIPFYAV